MQKVLTYAGYALAAVAAFWVAMPDTIHYLVFAMGLDICSGFLVAVTNSAISSRVAWNGVSKKVATLILIALVYVGGRMLDIGFAPQLVSAVTGFYIYTELVSIFENATLLGVPIPDFLKNALMELNPDKRSLAEKQKILMKVPAPVLVTVAPEDPTANDMQSMTGS